MAVDQRLQQLKVWLKSLHLEYEKVEPASADASFRRYFRVFMYHQTLIVMDAPPDKEDCTSFIKVARLMLSAGVHVPEILEMDLEQGFLLLSDLGTQPYQPLLTDESVDRLYGDAMAALLQMQRNIALDADLPRYDEAMLTREMELFREWFVPQQLGMTLDDEQNGLIEAVFAQLVSSALEQPQVCVHRDYHSRNLMVLEEHNPGVIDFQDAVIGPITYDLVSLLRDCYISWPQQRLDGWLLQFQQQAITAGLLTAEQGENIERWFDLMGMQRHIKVLGIFSRLNIRDNKPNYLKDIPLTFEYLVTVSERYPEFSDFSRFLRQVIEPRLSTIDAA